MQFKNKDEYIKKIKRVIITEEEIREAIKKTGKKISKDYEGKPLLLIAILKGSFMLLSDICKEITIPCEVGFMAARSYYEGTESSRDVEITLDIQQDISRYHVIIIEDIVDTGRTLSDIVKLLKGRNPLSLKVITLLDKPDRRCIDFKADEVLFTIPDVFVIGYGLDCGEYFRNLPYIAEYEQ